MTPSGDVGRLGRRIDDLRRMAAENGLRAVILCSPARRIGAGVSSLGNTGYFLGYTPMGGTVALVVPVESAAVVYSAGFNESRMLAQRVDGSIEVRDAGAEALGAALATFLAEHGVKADAPIGIAGLRDLPLRTTDSLSTALPNLRDIDLPIEVMRSVGDEADIALHRRAAEISDAMIETAFTLAVEPGMTPPRLMAEVERTGRVMGADASTLWLAVGPTPPVTCFEFFELAENIQPGDRIQLGTNVTYEGHFAQGLRMAVRATPSPELEAMSQKLLAIQDAALETLRVGKPVHALSDTLERMIDDTTPFTPQNDPFRFQSCHQLGLDYSEPYLAAALARHRDKAGDANGPSFRAGMVLEIHPNFSIPGLGHVCVGDTVLVTPDGAEWLTRYPRGLKVLPV